MALSSSTKNRLLSVGYVSTKDTLMVQFYFYRPPHTPRIVFSRLLESSFRPTLLHTQLFGTSVLVLCTFSMIVAWSLDEFRLEFTTT